MSDVERYLEELTDVSTTALIMWDFQRGLGGNAWNLDSLIEVNNRLLAAADKHSIPVIWSQHTLPPIHLSTPGLQVFLMQKQKVTRVADLKPFMQLGDPLRDFVDGLQPREHDIVIQKSSPDFFVGTTLEQQLRALGTRSLAIAGVTTEIGVDVTAKHALSAGFPPFVIEDACGSYTPEAHQAGIASMRSWIPVTSSEEIMRFWDANAAK